MPRSIRIFDLNGRMISCTKNSEQTWKEVMEKAGLPRRFGYCLRHWLAGGEVDDSMEKRIKEYLDRVGYILIQDAPDDGIISDYKEMRDRVATIPASASAQTEDIMYGTVRHADEDAAFVGRQRQDMTRTEAAVMERLTRAKGVAAWHDELEKKRQRIRAVNVAHPDMKVAYVPVDTENEFSFGGKRWRISPDVKQYQPKAVGDDLLYDMDQVVCVEAHDMTLFYDQDWYEITGKVEEI